jgi:hypothetical protein
VVVQGIYRDTLKTPPAERYDERVVGFERLCIPSMTFDANLAIPEAFLRRK